MTIDKPQESLQQFEVSLLRAQELNERVAQRNILMSMSRLYYRLGNRHKATEYQKLAIGLFNEQSHASDDAT